MSPQLSCYDQAKQLVLTTGLLSDNVFTHFLASFIAVSRAGTGFARSWAQDPRLGLPELPLRMLTKRGRAQRLLWGSRPGVGLRPGSGSAQ